MANKILQLLLACMLVTTMTACSTTDDSASNSTDDNGDNSAIVEDPTASGDTMTNVEDGAIIVDDGAIIVGDDYVSQNATVPVAGEQRAKLEALKQDATIYFAYNSEAIANNYLALLQAHAQFLRDNANVSVIIEGHTDERGTPEYNVALGERRTRSVAQYLMNLGVSANQISIVSYGEEKPTDPGHNESAWSKNRRAVIIY